MMTLLMHWNVEKKECSLTFGSLLYKKNEINFYSKTLNKTKKDKNSAIEKLVETLTKPDVVISSGACVDDVISGSCVDEVKLK